MSAEVENDHVVPFEDHATRCVPLLATATKSESCGDQATDGHQRFGAGGVTGCQEIPLYDIMNFDSPTARNIASSGDQHTE